MGNYLGNVCAIARVSRYCTSRALILVVRKVTQTYSPAINVAIAHTQRNYTALVLSEIFV